MRVREERNNFVGRTFTFSKFMHAMQLKGNRFRQTDGDWLIYERIKDPNGNEHVEELINIELTHAHNFDKAFDLVSDPVKQDQANILVKRASRSPVKTFVLFVAFNATDEWDEYRASLIDLAKRPSDVKARARLSIAMDNEITEGEDVIDELFVKMLYPKETELTAMPPDKFIRVLTKLKRQVTKKYNRWYRHNAPESPRLGKEQGNGTFFDRNR